MGPPHLLYPAGATVVELHRIFMFEKLVAKLMREALGGGGATIKLSQSMHLCDRFYLRVGDAQAISGIIIDFYKWNPAELVAIAEAIVAHLVTTRAVL
jgi:hypothetical protein